MTPLPSVPGVIRVDLIHQYGEDANAASRFFLSYTGTPTQAQMTQLASNVNIEWGSKFQALCGLNVKVVEIVCTDLSNPAGLVGISTPTSVGTRTGATLTAETCAVVNFKLARRFRGGHPRNYLPLGVATDLADAQTWTAGFFNTLSTNAAAFYPGIIGLTGGPTLQAHVSVSYFHGSTWVQNPANGSWHQIPTPRATPLVETVAGYGVRLKPGSQRRRMLG